MGPVEIAVCGAGHVSEEDAGLFEALPESGHEEREPSLLHTKKLARLLVTTPRADLLSELRVIVLVDLPSGKYERTTDEVRVEMPPQHADLKAL
jgi:hypothetical protein